MHIIVKLAFENKLLPCHVAPLYWPSHNATAKHSAKTNGSTWLKKTEDDPQANRPVRTNFQAYPTSSFGGVGATCQQEDRRIFKIPNPAETNIAPINYVNKGL